MCAVIFFSEKLINLRMSKFCEKLDDWIDGFRIWSDTKKKLIEKAQADGRTLRDFIRRELKKIAEIDSK